MGKEGDSDNPMKQPVVGRAWEEVPEWAKLEVNKLGFEEGVVRWILVWIYKIGERRARKIKDEYDFSKGSRDN